MTRLLEKNGKYLMKIMIFCGFFKSESVVFLVESTACSIAGVLPPCLVGS
jgi:hypothetical protein